VGIFSSLSIPCLPCLPFSEIGSDQARPPHCSWAYSLVFRILGACGTA
jgi:hypothetical protein